VEAAKRTVDSLLSLKAIIEGITLNEAYFIVLIELNPFLVNSNSLYTVSTKLAKKILL